MIKRKEKRDRDFVEEGHMTGFEFMFSIGSKMTKALFIQVSLLTSLFAILNDKMGATFRTLQSVC